MQKNYNQNTKKDKIMIAMGKTTRGSRNSSTIFLLETLVGMGENNYLDDQ